ncbi:hypothetical protein GGP78_003202 [Salinibacter ruber]|uniref:DUF4277 domain-containing protein n=1 Tax=Salinibacter ruber TaxID=146919 RepID=UPI002169C4D8|nr:DUF4277 domain-containing protein [Salinibacter ruber]MCS3856499.1 hypothetical protein [Salinibacter ruber]
MINPKEPQTSDLSETEILQSKVVDHPGLVAEMFAELEIGDGVDEQIAQDMEECNGSVGQAVKALVLTALGFAQQPLYLAFYFFEKMPTDRLIVEQVGNKPGATNDTELSKLIGTDYAQNPSAVPTEVQRKDRRACRKRANPERNGRGVRADPDDNPQLAEAS